MNLHTLGNRDEEDNQGSRQPLFGNRNNQGNQNMSNMFMGSQSDQNRDPRNETFLQMIYLNFCPLATLWSFVMFISLILLIVYVVQLSVGRRRI